MEAAVDKYVTEQVKTKRAVGELNHPEGPTVNLDKVSHLIESLDWNGNDVIGRHEFWILRMVRLLKVYLMVVCSWVSQLVVWEALRTRMASCMSKMTLC